MKKSDELTQRQQQCLDFIVQYRNENGFPPTLREIGDHMGHKSPSTPYGILTALYKKGKIDRRFSCPRGIKVLEDA